VSVFVFLRFLFLSIFGLFVFFCCVCYAYLWVLALFGPSTFWGVGFPGLALSLRRPPGRGGTCPCCPFVANRLDVRFRVGGGWVCVGSPGEIAELSSVSCRLVASGVGSRAVPRSAGPRTVFVL